VRGLLDVHGGNVSKAAEAAELDRAYLYRLLRRHRDG
jgi:transcriptional regulator of acetoin/glycerol metabolism